MDNVDPMIKRLDSEEQKVIRGILAGLPRQFPNQELGHQLKEPTDTYFSIYVAGKVSFCWFKSVRV